MVAALELANMDMSRTEIRVPLQRGYVADRYAKSKDTAYTKIIADTGLNLHYRSAVMETYGAFSKDLWSLVTVLTTWWQPCTDCPHGWGGGRATMCKGRR